MNKSNNNATLAETKKGRSAIVNISILTQSSSFPFFFKYFILK